MADHLEQPSLRKIAPELRQARSLGIKIMVAGAIVAMLLDGGAGGLAMIALVSAVAYWAVFAFIAFLRAEKPIWLDLFFARFGFLLLFIFLTSVARFFF
jgi:hypothetical protein